MRIPLSKVYRAFPELDRFSDAECEGFVRLVREQYAWAERRASWGNVALAIVGSLVVILPALWASNALYQAKWGVPWRASELVFLFGLLVGLGMASLWCMVRYDRWLKGAILDRLKGLRCPDCEYSLLGLRVVDGGITCPECGQRFDLAARGLTAADVLAKSPAPTE